MATPNLGYNQKNETQIDTFNQWFRAQPEYQRQLKEWGIDPNNVHLAKSQSQQLLKLAQGMGAVVDEGDMEVDPAGNFNPKGHKLRNALVIGGIAGAALLTAGLATPLLAGGGGAAGGAAGAGSAAAAAGGTLASTTIGTGMLGGIAGGTGLAGGAAAAGAGTAASVAAAAKAASAGSSIWSKAAGLAGPVGKAIGGASSAAGNNRLEQERLGLQANRDNINGNAQAEAALMNRSQQEAAERRLSLIDVARASDTRNPNVSEFNTRGPKKYSDEYMGTLTDLEQRALARLKADPTYSTNNMPVLRSYQPLDIADLQGATNTKPGLMERIGNFAGPALSVYGGVTGQRSAVAPPRARVTDDEDY